MMHTAANASAKAASRWTVTIANVARQQHFQQQQQHHPFQRQAARAVCHYYHGGTVSSTTPASGTGVPRRRALSSAAAALDGGDGVESESVKNDGKPRRRRLLRERPAPITLTDRAAIHLTQLLAGKPGKVGVRLGVKRRGCNGMSYTLKYADEKPKGDEEVAIQDVSPQVSNSGSEEEQSAIQGDGGQNGAFHVKLFVDPMATLYIAGTVMDWEETELSSEFTFRNPNAKGECGCGESFNV